MHPLHRPSGPLGNSPVRQGREAIVCESQEAREGRQVTRQLSPNVSLIVRDAMCP